MGGRSLVIKCGRYRVALLPCHQTQCNELLWWYRNGWWAKQKAFEEDQSPRQEPEASLQSADLAKPSSFPEIIKS